MGGTINPLTSEIPSVQRDNRVVRVRDLYRREARVDWDDGSEDYLLVPAACEGVIKKTNRSLKHLTPHRRPAPWMVILEVS